ncbi:MAG TPA: hypothetical protein PKX91_05835 [Clostridia bacterium]|jgi:hypothetical protein|nr:hypothetical protein [Clostridia bacterium]
MKAPSSQKINVKKRVRELVLIALLTAVLSAGKMALSFIPNVEIVTVCIIAFTFVFGIKIGMPSTLIFCAIEGAIYGLAPWLLSYFIYWPLLSVVTALLTKAIHKNKVAIPVLIAFFMTSFFGVLTTFVDTCFYSGGQSFWNFYAAMYVRGIYFYLVHIISNIIVVGVLFTPLTKLLEKNKEHYFA